MALHPHVRFLDRTDGDYADPDGAPHPGGDVPCRPWTWLRQVHGADVVTVTHPGHHAGAPADGVVTANPNCALLVRTADCAPVALLASTAVGLAHAGWRGLMAGVVETTVAEMRRLGATDIKARIGPCISPSRYEFGVPVLDELVERYGPDLSSLSDRGAPALDLRAGVRAALEAAGAELVGEPAPCTASRGDRLFSHRARAETGRQASFVWLSP